MNRFSANLIKNCANARAFSSKPPKGKVERFLPRLPEVFSFENKIVVVTGGASGIGQGIATRFAEAGASVFITDIDEKRGNETRDDINAKFGDRCTFTKADVRSVVDAMELVNEIKEKHQGRGVDILVNNAAIFPVTPFLVTTEKSFTDIVDVNLKGPFFYTQAVAKSMIDSSRGGKIVNISSKHTMRPKGYLAPYEASKAGVMALTLSLAKELAPFKINVNTISTGAIMTPGSMEQAKILCETRGETLDQFLTEQAAKIPLHRLGSADDVALPTLFLSSSAADYITGATLVVDGGAILH